jgi:hypothetical protein
MYFKNGLLLKKSQLAGQKQELKSNFRTVINQIKLKFVVGTVDEKALPNYVPKKLRLIKN